MLDKIRDYVARKAVEFAGGSEWYRRQGFHRLADRLDGYPDDDFSISDKAALQQSTWFCCVKVLGEDIGIEPCFLYQRDPATDYIRKAKEDPLYELLHDLPNPETNAGTFFEALTAHAAAVGHGYAHIMRNTAGTVVGLWPIMPDSIRRRHTDRGTLFYEIYNRGQWDSVDRAEVLDIPGFSWSGGEGESVARLAKRTLRLAMAQEKYAGDFFERDATPGVAIEYPAGTSLSDPAVQNIKKGYKESVRSHDVAVLREGAKLNVVGKTNVESQLLEQRRFQVLEVCRWFRMPSFKLGDLERMTFSNVEQVRIDYTTNVLRPWNKRWRESIYRCLLTPEQRREGYYAELSVRAHLEGDFKTQTEGFRALLEKGVYSINEVRAWYNLNPIEGGDSHHIQMNMQSVVDAATQAAALEAEAA